VPAAWTDLPPPPPLAPRAPLREGEARPRVSVVMPTYRRAHLVGGTIRSLLGQTFADFELLVRDDGPGDDGTEEAVHAARSGDPRVKYHRNPKNLRMPGNLNAGIADSVGDYIAVCHDHDLYHPDFLDAYVKLLDRCPSALFAHTGIEMVDQEDKPLGQAFVGDFAELTKGADWLAFMLSAFTCPVCALTMVRREAHERHGLYDPAYGFIADVEMWMRLSRHGDVAFAARPLVRVRTREDGHEASVNPWPIYAITFAIHRRYTGALHHGPERLRREALLPLRADLHVLRELASRFRHRSPIGLGASVEPLRASAGPLSRALLPLVGPAESLVRMVRT
jgi:glycosyltransferase involved in cell wall biosynthesis